MAKTALKEKQSVSRSSRCAPRVATDADVTLSVPFGLCRVLTRAHRANCPVSPSPAGNAASLTRRLQVSHGEKAGWP